MQYILITDIFFRKSFDVISILKKEFKDIHFLLGLPFVNKSTKINAAILYRGTFEVLRTENCEIFCKDIQAISEKYYKDEIIYIPVEENTTDFFIYFIEKNGKHNFRFLLPERKIFETLRDKYNLNKYCLDHQIGCPQLYNLKDLNLLPNEVYPLLLKPCIGSGSKGIFRLISPNCITEDIHKAIQENDYLIQELIPNGQNVKGAFFLCNNGKVVGSYTHERIRTSPPSGGVTILSRIGSNDQIISEGIKLLESIKWNGLVMLEFLYDERSDKYKIIEANPRIWGSIMLSEFSGANLLSNYVRLCLNKRVENIPLKINVMIRWFFPVDILNYVKAKGHIHGFWNFKNTCFINWSYAPFISALWFNFQSIFNSKNIIRFLRR